MSFNIDIIHIEKLLMSLNKLKVPILPDFIIPYSLDLFY